MDSRLGPKSSAVGCAPQRKDIRGPEEVPPGALWALWAEAGAGGDSRRLRAPRSSGKVDAPHVGANPARDGNSGVSS